MQKTKHTHKITFNGDGTTFSAITEARKYLEGQGYSVGRMCANAPIGFKEGNWDIQKWYNLDVDDKKLLDGIITSKDFREGTVTVEIY